MLKAQGSVIADRQPARTVLTDEHGYVGVEKQFTIPSRIPVRRDVDAGRPPSSAWRSWSQAYRRRTFSGPRQFGPSKSPVKRWSAPTDKARGQYVVYLEQVAERTKVDLE